MDIIPVRKTTGRSGPTLHAPSGTETLDVLLPVRVARHLQPICGRVDGRRTGELGAGRTAHRANLPQARHRARDADPALGSRGTDDQQVHRAAAGRPRGDPLAQPSPGQRRQPLLRGAVQDPEVPPRLPRAVRRHRGHDRLLPFVLPLGHNTEHRHAGIAMLTPHDVDYGRASQILEKRERTLRLAWSRHSERFVNGTPKPQPLPQGLDQPPGRSCDSTACSVISNRRCLNIVDRFRCSPWRRFARVPLSWRPEALHRRWGGRKTSVFLVQVAGAASCGDPRKKNRCANLRKVAGLPPSILTGNERRCGSTVSSRRGSDRPETERDRQHRRRPGARF